MCSVPLTDTEAERIVLRHHEPGAVRTAKGLVKATPEERMSLGSLLVAGLGDGDLVYGFLQTLDAELEVLRILFEGGVPEEIACNYTTLHHVMRGMQLRVRMVRELDARFERARRTS